MSINAKKISSLLSLIGVLPEGDLKKGLTKASPYVKKAFANAGKYGFGTGATMLALKNFFGSEGVEYDPKERPDEATFRKQMATDRDFSRRAKMLGSAAALAIPASRMAALGRTLAQGGREEDLEEERTPETIEIQPEEAQAQQQQQVQQESPGVARQAATALGQITSLEDLARLDPAVAQKVGEGLQRGLEVSDIEGALKRSRILGPRTMMIERKLGKPISWIIDYITNRPEEQRRPQGQNGGTDSLLQNAMDLLGGR